MHAPYDPFVFARYVQTIPTDQLVKLQTEITVAITRINIQLDQHEEDPDWTNRAKTNLRYSTWRLKTVDRQINLRQREEFLNQQRSYTNQFVEKARELLDQDTFNVIASEANKNNFRGLTPQQALEKDGIIL